MNIDHLEYSAEELRLFTRVGNANLHIATVIHDGHHWLVRPGPNITWVGLEECFANRRQAIAHVRHQAETRQLL